VSWAFVLAALVRRATARQLLQAFMKRILWRLEAFALDKSGRGLVAS